MSYDEAADLLGMPADAVSREVLAELEDVPYIADARLPPALASDDEDAARCCGTRLVVAPASDQPGCTIPRSIIERAGVLR